MTVFHPRATLGCVVGGHCPISGFTLPVSYARNSPPKPPPGDSDRYCAGDRVGAGAFITGGGFHLPVSASLFGA